MAAGATTPGRRIPNERAGTFYNGAEPGDYCGPVRGYTGAKPALFFVLPNGLQGHITAPPHDEITEHDDGTVSVSPSILRSAAPGWHGHLEHGVWRELE